MGSSAIVVVLIGGAFAGTLPAQHPAGKAPTAFVSTPGATPRYGGPKGRESDFTEVLASRQQTGGAMGLVRQTIAPKSGPPTHLHRTEDEFFYVVSGQFSVKVGDRLLVAPAGSFLFVPRGTPHTFRNLGAEPGVILVGVVPGGFEKMFEEREGVDDATNKALMQKHHMETVGPPIQ